MADRQLCRQICSKVANSVGGLLTIFGYLFMCSHVFARRSFKNQLKKNWLKPVARGKGTLVRDNIGHLRNWDKVWLGTK
jgi:hypothetical protein